MTTFLAILFSGVATVYAALLWVLYSRQRHLIYHPGRDILTPAQYGLSGFSEAIAKTPDGEAIQLWHREAARGLPTIVYFHGNAGHIGNRAAMYGALADKGFGVLGVSYRGYGRSTGTPTEAGIYNDARTAITYLTQQKHVPVTRIMLYGESLGTGVAVQMATEFAVAAVILQAPYTSVAARAAELYFYVPVNLMIKDSYNSLAKINKVHSPLLVFHGERDDVIPLAHGKRLFDAANMPKEAVFFPSGGHNDFDSAVISEHVSGFAQKHQLIG